jgi:4-amino-4-deoxy-L-arabinose transferase-like glycosyltransferase
MSRTPRRVWLALAGVLALALLSRLLLLASGAVSFHSDEAVVGLMARHILAGERPVFFYGQAYMGSLDAWLIAAGFALAGESVLTIRLVQSALYLGVVAVSFWLAWRLTGRAAAALACGALFAVPPVLLALYTTATLGGYNETLLLGGLCLLLAWSVTHDDARAWLRWAALGLAGGLGWWANGLIAIALLPAAGLIALWLARGPRGGRRAALGGIGLAALGFVIGSAPWWVFALQHDLAPLRFFIGGTAGGFAGGDVLSLSLGERLIGLVFLGLPTLAGARFPWEAGWFTAPLGVPLLLLFAFAAWRAARGRLPLQPGAAGLLLGMLALFAGVFLASRFSSDPTGRYFLPISLPLFVLFGALAASLERRWLGTALVAGALGFFAFGQWSAARSGPGLTTQFNLVTHIPNTHDAELIAFLEERGLTRGYSTYWVSFRTAFLSGERVQLSAALPYKPDLSYTPLDERYPPFRAAADAAGRFAIISANVPEVDALIERALAAAPVTWQRTQIGPFTIYHDFSPAARAPRPPFVTP